MIQYNNHNITKKIHYDGHDIQKVYGCDAHLVWEYNPTGYTELDYILTNNANSSGVRLLTKADNTTVIEVDCQVIYAQGDAELISGCDSRLNIYTGVSRYNYCSCDFGGNWIDLKTCPSFKDRNTWRIGRVNSSDTTKVGWSCGNSGWTSTNDSLTFNGVGNILVGGLRYPNCAYNTPTSGDSSNYVECRIYSIKVYNNYGSNLVGNYIPVQTNEGFDTMYDTVSHQFATPYGLVNTNQ